MSVLLLGPIHAGCVFVLLAVRSTSLGAEDIQRGLIDRVTSGTDIHRSYGSPYLLRPVFELFGRMELNWDQGEEWDACVCGVHNAHVCVSSRNTATTCNGTTRGADTHTHAHRYAVDALKHTQIPHTCMHAQMHTHNTLSPYLQLKK